MLNHIPETSSRREWRQLLAQEKPLQLPAAHDALCAKLIERAGFTAYQVGGFAMEGARYGFPDIDLSRLGEKSEAVRQIMGASNLPVLVDMDDGYGDVKNVTHTIQLYEAMGVSAVFMEDQEAPKRCGHMADKKLVPISEMVWKIKAAIAARREAKNLFIVARTDAIAGEGLDEALKRGEEYLKAGADGIYVEAPKGMKQLERIGREFRHVPQMANMLEGDEETPWVSPEELAKMGFAMALYPTSILFRATKAMESAVSELRAGRKQDKASIVTREHFDDLVGLPFWKDIEEKFQGGQRTSVKARAKQWWKWKTS